MSQVLVHAGAEEAIFNFMNVAVKPGDHVIVHAPYYQSLGEVARGVGAEVAEWPGDPTHGWQLDLDVLKATLTERTKVLVINFPHNPTGFLPASAFVRQLSDLSNQHGFLIFSDEVYRGLELDPSDRLPALADINERAVSLGVMSKTYGLAGLRIGWIATRNASLFHELAAFKDYTTICNSAPSEFLATLALRHHRQAQPAHHPRQPEAVGSFFQCACRPVFLVSPQGGFHCLPAAQERIRRGLLRGSRRKGGCAPASRNLVWIGIQCVPDRLRPQESARGA
jgi:aspartate/methionine/tyrosine aminotransferase